MKPTKLFIFYSTLLGLSGGLSAFGCGTAKSNATTQKHAAISGIVSDENSTPLSGVTIALGSSQTASAVTDVSGKYSLSVESDSNIVVLTTHNPNYAARSTRVNLNSTNVVNNFKLRHVDQTVPIVLPTGNANAIEIVQNQNDGSTKLIIPPDSLVLPDGTLAQGNATISLTYWNPQSPLTQLPGDLAAVDPSNANQIVGLRSFGMTDIEILQNDQKLQVASGKALSLIWSLTAADQNYIHAIDVTSALAPKLWYLDPQTGLWNQEGSLADGSMSYQADAATYTATLPHLSSWNLDAIDYPTGCIQGQLVDTAGRVIKDQNLKLWFLSTGEFKGIQTGEHTYANVTINEQTLMAYDINSDNTGAFCLNTYGQPTVGIPGPEEANYFISYGDPKNAVCNPLTFDSLSSCTSSVPQVCMEGSDWINTSSTCQLNQAEIAVCHYCAGQPFSGPCNAPTATFGGKYQIISESVEGGCTNLGKITISIPPGCSDKSGQQGSACFQDACCAGDLICKDYLCVPPSDPNVILK